MKLEVGKRYRSTMGDPFLVVYQDPVSGNFWTAREDVEKKYISVRYTHSHDGKYITDSNDPFYKDTDFDLVEEWRDKIKWSSVVTWDTWDLDGDEYYLMHRTNDPIPRLKDKKTKITIEEV